jgi:hypothetical protein
MQTVRVAHWQQHLVKLATLRPLQVQVALPRARRKAGTKKGTFKVQTGLQT